MAFELTMTKSVYGQTITIPNAYHRIALVEGNKEKVTIQLISYDSTKSHVVESQFYQFIPSQDENAARWDKQGYEYLKTTDEFKDAIDV